MKKTSKKAVASHQWHYLKENELTEEELRVIRKLNGASSVPGYDTGFSKRTVEAMLQGRRKADPSLLQQAIRNAKNTLDRYTEVMNNLLKKLSSGNDTTKN